MALTYPSSQTENRYVIEMPVSTEGEGAQESKVYILELEKRLGQLLKLRNVEVETASETPRWMRALRESS